MANIANELRKYLDKVSVEVKNSEVENIAGI